MVAYLRDASPITPTMGEGEKQNIQTLLPSVNHVSNLLPDTCEWQSKVLRKLDLH